MFGVQVRQGVTQHGLALNLSNDTSVFANIRVCGVAEQSMDRLINHCNIRSIEGCFSMWSDLFQRKFH